MNSCLSGFIHRIMVSCVVVVGCVLLVLPQTVLGWGSLRDGRCYWDCNTHGGIDNVAWDRLENELEATSMVNFPKKAMVNRNDFVSISWLGDQETTSTGPDYEPSGGTGPITKFIDHYRGGKDAANRYYNNLIDQMKSRKSGIARSAAWLAHFLADQYVPFHTIGKPYTKGNQPPQPKDLFFGNYTSTASAQRFIAAATAATNGNYDWYDPTYWDSAVSTMNSTHIQWERAIVPPQTTSPDFDSLWSNTAADRMATFTEKVQGRTTADTPTILDHGPEASRDAARGVYTAWRSTLSSFQLKLNVRSGDFQDADSFIVSAVVRNGNKLFNANNVQAEITLPPELTLKDQRKKPVGSGGVLSKMTNAEPVEWEVSGSPTGCAEINEIKVKVTGNLDGGVPDAASVINGGVEAPIFPPPIVKITSPDDGSTITEQKVTVIGTISDEYTKAWIEVNGSDKFWISDDYTSGSTFSKEVSLKEGANDIVVKAINKCGKEGRAATSITGEFKEPAIKVVMSWNTNNTDVDLHLTDSNGGDECYYGDDNPDWGDPSTETDDPLLDIDNIQGYGPETITIKDPKPGSYTVRVEYYSDHDDETAIPSFVTVKVYEYGILKGTFTNTLPDTDATWEGVYTFVVPAKSQKVNMPAVEPLPGFTIYESRITTNANATQPVIDGDQIVWSDGRNGSNKQIFRYNLNTSQLSRVSTTSLSSLQERSSLSTAAIVWEDYRDYDPSIYSYNVSSGVETRIMGSTNVGNSRVDISGGKMVWEDTRRDTETSGNADIYVYDLGNGIEKQLTTNTMDQLAPRISADHVVWTDTRNGGYTIFMYDLATNTEQQIARASSGMRNPPAIDGNLVVWEDGRAGNGDIYLYDIGTREETQLTTNTAEQTSPDVSGNKVVWVDYRNGKADIYLYDLASRTEVPICTHAADKRDPRISGNRIVWTDYRNGAPDIYMAEVNPTTPVVTVTATTTTAREAGLVPGHFTVSRAGSTAAPLTVYYATSGSALSGSDYAALPGNVTIAAGSSSAIIPVTPLADVLREDDETVVVTLAPNAAYTAGFPEVATVTIKDDTPQSLAVAINGSGDGTVNSVPTGIACGKGPSGICTALFSQNSEVTLTPSPVPGSVFTGWTGECIGNGNCRVTMASGKAVGCTFDYYPACNSFGHTFYSSLQSAYNNAAMHETVQVQAATLEENPSLGRTVAITIKGGYDPYFRSVSGFTVLHGTLSIQHGVLIVDGLAIR